MIQVLITLAIIVAYWVGYRDGKKQGAKPFIDELIRRQKGYVRPWPL